jgi:hypothetical protein
MRREYRGGARRAQLTAPLGSSTANLTITCDNLDNWPTGISGRPFFVVLGRDTPVEEKILCSSRSGNVITVFNAGIINGRGADDTLIAAHATGTFIEHVFTATDANEANQHVNNTQPHITAVTSTTRPVSPSANQVILETDTRRVLAYINGQWQAVSSDSDGGLSPLFLIGA